MACSRIATAIAHIAILRDDGGEIERVGAVTTSTRVGAVGCSSGRRRPRGSTGTPSGWSRPSTIRPVSRRRATATPKRSRRRAKIAAAPLKNIPKFASNSWYRNQPRKNHAESGRGRSRRAGPSSRVEHEVGAGGIARRWRRVRHSPPRRCRTEASSPSGSSSRRTRGDEEVQVAQVAERVSTFFPNTARKSMFPRM